ncbi:MAG: prepilin peptidase, partial [Lentihominibacter sp.]
MRMEIILLETVPGLVLGILAGEAAVRIFNLIPWKWLCDYGENPVERGNAVAKARKLTSDEAENITRSLVDSEFRRIKENPWRWVFGAGFSCLLVKLMMEGGLETLNIQYVTGALVFCWGLLLIGLADLKYMIIPDQLLLIPAVAGAGFLPVQLATVRSLRQEGGFPLELSGLSDGAAAALCVLSGAATGVLLMLLVGGLGRLIAGPGRDVNSPSVLGGGDVKLYGVLGFCLGVPGIVFVFLLSSLTAGIDGAIALAGGKAE